MHMATKRCYLAVMRAWIAALAAFALIAPSQALAEDVSLCAHLAALAERAEKGEVVRVWVSNVLGGDLFIACGPSDQADARAYCDDVVRAAGMHGFSGYPFRVRACLQSEGVRADARGRQPGKGRAASALTHVAAPVKGGVRLDLVFVPETTPDGDAMDFYGRYDLVLWRP